MIEIQTIEGGWKMVMCQKLKINQGLGPKYLIFYRIWLPGSLKWTCVSTRPGNRTIRDDVMQSMSVRIGGANFLFLKTIKEKFLLWISGFYLSAISDARKCKSWPEYGWCSAALNTGHKCYSDPFCTCYWFNWWSAQNSALVTINSFFCLPSYIEKLLLFTIWKPE